ncbi:MAG: hypothetical protein D6738_11845 [Acidobacteria bacterium]|nr:MAG: hypothetical protein D6738_11845 [Acidobacteriota bacterium]
MNHAFTTSRRDHRTRDTISRRARRLGTVLVLLLVAGLALPVLAERRVDREILVELIPGADPDAVAQRYGCTVIDGIPQWLLYILLAPEGADVDQLVAQMNDPAETDIVSAEPHREFENPEGGQRTIGELDRNATIGDFRNQPALGTVNANGAQQQYTGRGVVVAVLDTGQTTQHPATSERIMKHSGADLAQGNGSVGVQPNAVDDDGDGDVDEMLEHGSMVTGMVNAAAPGARILPIRVLDSEGWGRGFWVAKGILHAISRGADVINLSLGMLEKSNFISKAINEARKQGVVVVAAAGNRNIGTPDYPADDSKVVSVAAVDDAKLRAPFTSYGSEIDLTAPGVQVLSTYGADGYARWDGTSFAAPMTAGAVALLLERYPGLKPDEVRDLLAATAQPDANGPEWSDLLGAGTLDVAALVTVVTGDRTSLKLSEQPGGTVVRWSPVDGATVYDLARGDVANLRHVGLTDIDLGPVTCLRDDTTTLDTLANPDPTLPAPGQAFFYVFRDDTSESGGLAYGQGSDSRYRTASGGDCNPPL